MVFGLTLQGMVCYEFATFRWLDILVFVPQKFYFFVCPIATFIIYIIMATNDICLSYVTHWPITASWFANGPEWHTVHAVNSYLLIHERESLNHKRYIFFPYYVFFIFQKTLRDRAKQSKCRSTQLTIDSFNRKLSNQSNQ